MFRSPSRDKAIKQTKTVDVIRDIGTAVEAYKLVHGSYPIGMSGHLEESFIYRPFQRRINRTRLSQLETPGVVVPVKRKFPNA